MRQNKIRKCEARRWTAALFPDKKYPFKAHAKDFSTRSAVSPGIRKLLPSQWGQGSDPRQPAFSAQSRPLLPSSLLRPLAGRSPLAGTRPPAGRTRPRTRRAPNRTPREGSEGEGPWEGAGGAGGARGGAEIRAVTIQARELPGFRRRKTEPPPPAKWSDPGAQVPAAARRSHGREDDALTPEPPPPSHSPLSSLIHLHLRLMSEPNDLHTARPSVEVMPALTLGKGAAPRR